MRSGCSRSERWCLRIEPEERIILVGLGMLSVRLRDKQRAFIVGVCALLGFVIFNLLLFYHKSLSDGLCNSNTVDYGDECSVISLLFNDAEREDLFVWRGGFWTV